MDRFGLQLWSVRDEFTTPEGVKDAFLKIAQMGYTTAQTAGTYDFISAQDFRSYADAAGVKIIGTHYDLERMKNDVAGTVAYHNALGAKVIGIGGAHFDTMSDVDAFIEEYNRLGKIYAGEGFTLSYHNHAQEFRKFDGVRIFDRLIEGLDPMTTNFCLDTYWAQYGGMDVCALIRKLRGRIKICHLKDMAAWIPFPTADGILYAPNMIEVGQGNLDFPEIVRVGEECGIEDFIVEDEFYSTGKPMESVAISAKYIRENLVK